MCTECFLTKSSFDEWVYIHVIKWVSKNILTRKLNRFIFLRKCKCVKYFYAILPEIKLQIQFRLNCVAEKYTSVIGIHFSTSFETLMHPTFTYGFLLSRARKRNVIYVRNIYTINLKPFIRNVPCPNSLKTNITVV